MEVTHVSLMPAELAKSAGRPSLTPELLAAVGARGSRTSDGFQHILSKIDFGNEDQKIKEFLAEIEEEDPIEGDFYKIQRIRKIAKEIRKGNLEKGIDGIFKMLDFGHQSIADMIPIAIFMDGLSLFLIYYIWYQCSMTSGIETSTRYCKFGKDGLVDPFDLGIPESYHPSWISTMTQAFNEYERALEFWTNLGRKDPELTRIPASLRSSKDEKDIKKLDRMEKNYAFDRARAFIPLACANNMMMVMNSRSWAQLVTKLLSHPIPEFNKAGELIRKELELVTPRTVKYARREDSFVQGIESEYNTLWDKGLNPNNNPLFARVDPLLKTISIPGVEWYPHQKLDAYDSCRVEIFAPNDVNGYRLADDLAYHKHRYQYIGPTMQRTTVRTTWNAVGMAELRDMNRHRTGNRHATLAPIGFYHALDEVGSNKAPELLLAGDVGLKTLHQASASLNLKEHSYMYWTLLGHQYPYEYVCQADRFAYILELRTGLGTHYRYASQYRDASERWFEHFPETRGLINLGNAEPE